jgi:hypothetical protein
MVEPEGTADVESTGERDALIDAPAAKGADEAGAAATDEDGGADAPKPVEPPRRRLVAELLEGQDVVEESSRPDLQLVAPPLHLETIDAGQPIYQLDLSSEEPQGVMVGAEPSAAVSTDDRDQGRASSHGNAHAFVKQMIMRRDRQIMAAERDGIGAYELAVGIDVFVRKVLEVARRED